MVEFSLGEIYILRSLFYGDSRIVNSNPSSGVYAYIERLINLGYIGNWDWGMGLNKYCLTYKGYEYVTNNCKKPKPVTRPRNLQ